MECSNLEVWGNWKSRQSTILFIPGTFISPAVYDLVQIPSTYQSIQVSWGTSLQGSWHLFDIGKNISSFIKKNQLKNVIVVGYSSGGIISMLTYLNDPSLIKGMVLSNTGANTKGHGDPHLPLKILQGWSEDHKQKFLARCFANPLTEETYQRFYRYLNKISNEAGYQATKSTREIDLTEQLSCISCPVHIVWGELDKNRTLDHLKQLTSGIQKTKVYLSPSGHSVAYEDPQTFSLALSDLVEQINP